LGSRRISPIKKDKNVNYESDSNLKDFYEESGHECSPDYDKGENCAICGSPILKSDENSSDDLQSVSSSRSSNSNDQLGSHTSN